jgi:hypothetical protein
MTGFLEDNLLRMEGLDDNDIARLNGIMGDLQNLVVVAKNHQAQFNRVATVLLPIIEKIIAKQRELR